MSPNEKWAPNTRPLTGAYKLGRMTSSEGLRLTRKQKRCRCRSSSMFFLAIWLKCFTSSENTRRKMFSPSTLSNRAKTTFSSSKLWKSWDAVWLSDGGNRSTLFLFYHLVIKVSFRAVRRCGGWAHVSLKTKCSVPALAALSAVTTLRILWNIYVSVLPPVADADLTPSFCTLKPDVGRC